MGYEVSYADDDWVNVTGFDFSPYKAVVVGEAASSSKLVNMVTNYGYPLPMVNLKGFMVRYDKWNWVHYDGTPPDKNNYPGYMEDRAGCSVGGRTLKILDADHYITQDFTADQEFDWTIVPCDYDKTLFSYGYDLTQDMSGAVALAKNQSTNITDPKYANVWAVPENTLLGDGNTTASRIAVFGTHQFGLADDENTMDGVSFMTADFMTLVQRAVEWVLGANLEPDAVDKQQLNRMNVGIYPNPAADFTTLRFTLDKPGTVSIKILNLAGQTVKIIDARGLAEGTNEIRINTGDLPGTFYMFRLEAGGEVYVGKFSIAR